MGAQTFHDLIDSVPPGAPCLVFDGHTTPYGELREDSTALAQALLEQGLRRGDTAAIWLPNLPQWLVVASACARIGVNLLPLNMRYGTREVGDFLQRTDCRALFYLPHYRGRRHDEILCAAEPGTLRWTISLGDRTGERSPDQVTSLGYDDLLKTVAAPLPADQQGAPEDTCITFASSGTTSQPKLIPHPQANVWRHAHDVGATLALGSQARLLLAVPFGGAYGFAMAITALGAGASLVIEEQFDPAEAAELMRRHGVTHMFGTDDMLDKVLDTLAPGAGFPALTAYGQANFTPALELTLPAKAASHGVRLRACYGLSEGMALFAMQPEDASAERRAAAGGVPVSPAARIRCRSLETGELLAPGEPGELEIWSPNLTPGYVGDPEGTARAFTDDGYLRTGDLGSTTPDGGMTLLSRIGDVLRIGGYLVNPLEIEETVLGLCEATACQVVAIDVGTSVRPVAFVVGGPGYVHDEQAIIAACRGRLATFKSPIRVFELDRFPTTDGPNGQKVQKNVLKQQATELVAQS